MAIPLEQPAGITSQKPPYLPMKDSFPANSCRALRPAERCTYAPVHNSRLTKRTESLEQFLRGMY